MMKSISTAVIGVMTVIGGMSMTGMVSAMAGAQVSAQASGDAHEGYPRNTRSYLVRFSPGEESQSGWRDGERLRAYAKVHEGRFIIFLSEGSIYRLDQPAQMKDLEPLYATLQELGKQQAALSSAQVPLGEQQRALGESQRSATLPAAQGKIGAAQGTVGRVQGELGRQQGEIGKQQGILGVAFYNQVQAIIDACLQDKSCPVVEPAKRPA